MIDWIKTAQGVAAIMAAIFATMIAWLNLGLPGLVFSPEAPIEALERLNRDTRLLVPAPAWWRANPFGMLWPEMECGVRGVGWRRPASCGAAAGGCGPGRLI